MPAARHMTRRPSELFNYCFLAARKGVASRDTRASFRFLASPRRVKMNVVRKALLQEISPAGLARPGHALGRSDISGSKSKLWRQKGTGRARAGSKTGPLWKGGGAVFGPRAQQPSSARRRNKKLWKAALNYVVYNGMKHSKVLLVQAPWHPAPSVAGLPAQQVRKIGLSFLNVGYQNCLFIVRDGVSLAPYQRAFFESIGNVTIVPCSTVKCIDMLRADRIIFVL